MLGGVYRWEIDDEPASGGFPGDAKRNMLSNPAKTKLFRFEGHRGARRYLSSRMIIIFFNHWDCSIEISFQKIEPQCYNYLASSL
jgi:hypothetical protein